MSNRKADEKSAAHKSKVSSATKIDGGLGGPKAMAKAAAKGKSVNIPTRPLNIDGVTKKIRLSALMVWRCLSQEMLRPENLLELPLMANFGDRKKFWFLPTQFNRRVFQEKLLRAMLMGSVP